jgi:hypothetical protein
MYVHHQETLPPPPAFLSSFLLFPIFLLLNRVNYCSSAAAANAAENIPEGSDLVLFQA